MLVLGVYFPLFSLPFCSLPDAESNYFFKELIFKEL